MSLSRSKKSLLEYKQLSPSFKDLCNLTRARSVASATTSPPRRGNGLPENSRAYPSFPPLVWLYPVSQMPRQPYATSTTNKVWNSQVPMWIFAQYSHLPETFTSSLMAKNFPQWPFPILFPLPGTIKLVRSSHFVLLIAFTYFISLSPCWIPGNSFVIYLLVHRFSLQLSHPAFFPGLRHPVFLLWVSASSFCASGHFF